jgi:hypothetical protein
MQATLTQNCALYYAQHKTSETDFVAEQRWEDEGGNHRQLQQLPCGDRKEDATTDPAQGTPRAFCYEVNATCT